MKKNSLLGRAFGNWTVVGECSERSEDNHTQWWCLCVCGTRKLLRGNSLLTGNSNSCGCLKIKQFKERFTKHGETGCSEYTAWQSMKRRCYSPNVCQKLKGGIKLSSTTKKPENESTTTFSI